MITENQRLTELQLNFIDLDKKFTRDQLDLWTFLKDLSEKVERLEKRITELKDEDSRK